MVSDLLGRPLECCGSGVASRLSGQDESPEVARGHQTGLYSMKNRTEPREGAVKEPEEQSDFLVKVPGLFCLFLVEVED